MKILAAALLGLEMFVLLPAGALGQVLQTLYSFSGAFGSGDGNQPFGALIQGHDGNFYGVTYYGGDYPVPTNGGYGSGEYGYGTVFELTSNGVESILAPFEFTNGAYPSGALVQGSDGNLYGTTQSGGVGGSAYGSGVVFQVTTNGILSVVYNIGYSGMTGIGGLIEASDGCLYGVSPTGGNGAGTIFRLPPGGPLTNIYLCNPSVEGSPSGGLIVGNDGKLYGVTSGAGANTGTVYSITTNGVFQILAIFTTYYPGGPFDRLLQASDGNFYGAASDGVNGSIFSVTPAGVVTCFRFPYDTGSYNSPNGGLVQAADGNLYGTTTEGGNGDVGSVFRMTLAGTFSYAVFNLAPVGWEPYAGLTLGNDGNLYGTCGLGGTDGSGSIFRVIMPGPLLSSSPSGSNLIFSWRTNYAGYTLQVSPDLTHWSNYANPPMISGCQFFVTNALTAGAGFFRLMK